MHKDSNHPPQVLKEIPHMIEKMTSKNSSTKAEFDKCTKAREEQKEMEGHLVSPTMEWQHEDETGT